MLNSATRALATSQDLDDAGQATIEHVATLFEGTFATATKDQKLPEAIRQWRVTQGDALFARFVKNHTVFLAIISDA